MFDAPEHLSPDIEWMLQSGQADRETLVSALASAYFQAVYQLALAVLDDHESAVMAVLQTFIAAVLNLHNYRSQTGAQNWLFGSAVEAIQKEDARLRRVRSWTVLLGRGQASLGISAPRTQADATCWLAVDRLKTLDRLVFYLHFLLKWQLEEIAKLLGTAPEEADQKLLHSRREVYTALQKAGLEGEALRGRNLDDFICRSLEQRWTVDAISGQDLELYQQEILRQAGQRAGKRRLRSGIKELLLVVLVIVVVWAGLQVAAAQKDSRTPGGATRQRVPTAAPTVDGLLGGELSRQLDGTHDVFPLAWRLDGQSVAFVTREHGWTEKAVLIVDGETGEIIFY